MKKRSRVSNKKMMETIGILVFGIGLLIYILKAGAEIAIPYTNDELVDKYASKYGLQKSLVAAVIFQESGYRTDVVSNKGAMGLMQIMPETGKWIAGKLNEDFTEENLLKPETNVKYGTWYLDYLISRYKNAATALAAYNAGPGNVDDWMEEQGISIGEELREIPFTETRNYVDSIMRMRTVYEKM
ncbi:MAG: lytic transglycosylase domain-containing protein, partial [Clostridiaceae bacterium]